MSDRPEIGDWAGPEGLTAVQDARLPETLAAAARSPFYRGRAPRDRAGLLAMPLTTKADLRDAYPFGLLAVDRRRLATYHESSGTTGTPSSSYYTEQDWLDLAERYARKWVGIRDTDTFLVRTPYALMITGHLAQAAARMRGATVVPADNRSTAMPYARVVRLLRDLRVTLTWSMPTDTLLWAAAARAAGLEAGRDFPALRALFVGGEPLGPARRARIARTWNVPVVEEYGATECGSLAGECPAGRLHLWADRAIFEVLTSDGRLRPAGRGQLVVTPLYREAMPLLRYNTEDEAEISAAPCPCGWELPTVRVLGRSAAVHRVAGAAVTQGDLEELVFALPGVLFWRARALPDRLVVELEGGRDEASALTAAIRDRYGVPAEVTALPAGGLLPPGLLTDAPGVVKPRALFGPDENWAKALSYY